MATYYKKIKGKNYDKKLIDTADSSVKGRGDGRISLNDAKKILATVKDSSEYSDIEKSTMKYIRDHYDFTPEADRWFRGEIRKWAAARGAAGKGKKPAPKAARPKMTAPAPAVSREEEDYPPLKASAKPEPHPQASSPSLGRRIVQFILIIIIIVIMFLLLIPSTREGLKNCISRLTHKTEQAQKMEEIKPAVPEAKKEVPTVQTKEPEKPAESGDYYTVQVKDDLISISEKVLGGYARWIDLYNANKDIIKNPTMIFPGQKLKLPPAKK